jgi:hypothetical protein
MQQLHMTLPMHKAQPWEESLSQCSSCCCGLGATDMKSQPTAIPLKRLINEPVWVDQWPLSGQKLQQAHILVQQQVKARHVELSNSP